MRSSRRRVALRDGDVVVVAQKAVSKAEGRVVALDGVEPSERARELAGPETDLRQLEVILTETERVVRSRNGLVIAETRHGFVCASAGVDHSNAAEPGTVILLPLDPDASAGGSGRGSRELAGADVAVIVTDSFGRPFRRGRPTSRSASPASLRCATCAARPTAPARAPLDPDRGRRRARRRRGPRPRGKADGIPVVIVRGASDEGDGLATELVIPADRDLFR